MSWWVTDYIAISEDETKQLCNIQADTVSDLPAQDQTATAGFIFVRGSKADVLSTSGKYIMNSSGQWILQKSGQEIEIGADDIVYDNTLSGMTATNVQDAIDELDSTDSTLQGQITSLSTTVDGKTTVAAIYGLPPTTIAPEENTTVSLNSYTTPGAYVVPTATAAGRVTESPVTTRGYRLEVKQYRSGTYYRQTIMPWGEPEAIYTRSRQGGTSWTAWYKFEATQVQTVQSLNSPLNLSRNDLNEQLDSNFDLIDSIPEEEEGEIE